MVKITHHELHFWLINRKTETLDSVFFLCRVPCCPSLKGPPGRFVVSDPLPPFCVTTTRTCSSDRQPWQQTGGTLLSAGQDRLFMESSVLSGIVFQSSITLHSSPSRCSEEKAILRFLGHFLAVQSRGVFWGPVALLRLPYCECN